ncbi:hypothetical protein BGZ80_001125 [Entomortierella chlamydospora]|uniref:Uncharacterized protein n=1 Tax=Entomortierella chlamydospora TaxID=101097 RepID=A0A9P6MSA0_9FUNG|nr:hypothetical protein BGZ80_001125 [Entomortierella chlamydospora]
MAKKGKNIRHTKHKPNRRKHKKHGHHHDHKDEASFGVLVCDSKTVSAVYCPTGTMKRPSSLKSHPEIYTAEKNSMKQSHRKNGEYGKSLAYMNMISMDMPCPKPISKDTENVLSQLTCQDLTIVEKEFNLDFYSNAIPARDRSKMTVQFVAPHSHQSVVWIQMLCIVASVSTRTLRLSVVVTQNGEDPKLVFDCASGSYKAGRSVCDPDKCVCSVTDSTVCGPEFLPECNLDSRLYTAGVGECNPGPCDCTSSSLVYESTFPDKCNLDGSALCNCPHIGSPPRCGTTFPSTCGLDGDTLFERTGEGADPIPKKKCIAGGCVEGTTQCVPDPCKCETAPMNPVTLAKTQSTHVQTRVLCLSQAENAVLIYAASLMEQPSANLTAVARPRRQM